MARSAATHHGGGIARGHGTMGPRRHGWWVRHDGAFRGRVSGAAGRAGPGGPRWQCVTNAASGAVPVRGPGRVRHRSWVRGHGPVAGTQRVASRPGLDAALVLIRHIADRWASGAGMTPLLGFRTVVRVGVGVSVRGRGRGRPRGRVPARFAHRWCPIGPGGVMDPVSFVIRWRSDTRMRSTSPSMSPRWVPGRSIGAWLSGCRHR